MPVCRQAVINFRLIFFEEKNSNTPCLSCSPGLCLSVSLSLSLFLSLEYSLTHSHTLSISEKNDQAKFKRQTKE